MVYCSRCGIANENGRQQCFRCQAALPATAPPPGNAGYSVDPARLPGSHGYAPPGVDDPYAPLRSALSRGEPDEQFLDQFSWAPGCGFYFFSHAMSLFFVLAMVTGLFDVLGNYIIKSYKANGGSAGLIVLLALADVGAIFGLLIWAGKVARRRRWERLKWESWEQFRSNELTWHTVGIVGWVIRLLLTVMTFCITLTLGLSGAS